MQLRNKPGFYICVGVSLIIQLIGYLVFIMIPESFYRGSVGSSYGVLVFGVIVTFIAVLLNDYCILISYPIGFVAGYVCAVLFGAREYDIYGFPINGLSSWTWHLLIICCSLVVGIVVSIIIRVKKSRRQKGEDPETAGK